MDILTGDWEIIVKVRTGSQDEYYEFLKRFISKQEGVRKTRFRRGLIRDDARHRKIAKITLPIWVFVSVTGVIVYAMLYW